MEGKWIGWLLYFQLRADGLQVVGEGRGKLPGDRVVRGAGLSGNVLGIKGKVQHRPLRNQIRKRLVWNFFNFGPLFSNL